MRVTSISPQISKILGSRSAITTIATACIGDLDHDRDLMDERHPLNAHVGDGSILEALLASALGAKLPCNVLQALCSVQQVATLGEYLTISDFLPLHVPELPDTTNVVRRRSLAR